MLELSKEHMYSVFYKQIRPKAPSAVVVLTDTDSLLLYCNDIPKMKLLKTLREGFDFSNYPKDHPLFSECRRAQPGFMKDESCGKHLVSTNK